MKSWLRDETTRINEVVNKHARLQAVGALSTTEIGERGSYDLTKAKTRETGSITRVEEFGLASLSEETMTVSPESITETKKPRKPSAGSNDPLEGEETRETIAPVSLAAYRFCSDTENEEADETKDRARKVGPIKRRMLGSIRGLMASTHLLHVHETDEVYRCRRSILFHSQ